MKAVFAGNKSVSDRRAEFGLASSFLGGTMLIVQLAVLSAVVFGVKDNQGVVYAFAIPFVMYGIGVPLGLLSGMIGFMQRRRNHTLAKVGLALAFSGPLLFALFIAV